MAAESDPPRTWSADVSDAHAECQVVDARFRSFGGHGYCLGRVECVATNDDNSLVSSSLDEDGEGRVLVVDNRGSARCAMLGGDLARKGARNGWVGVVVYGAVRDTVELRDASLAVFALHTCPRKSVKRGIGSRPDTLELPGARIHRGDVLVADADGIVVTPGASFIVP